MNRMPAALLMALSLGDAGVGIVDHGNLVDHHLGLRAYRRNRVTGVRKVQRAARKRRNQLRAKAAMK